MHHHSTSEMHSYIQPETFNLPIFSAKSRVKPQNNLSHFRS
jgi:hypothetical protein